MKKVYTVCTLLFAIIFGAAAEETKTVIWQAEGSYYSAYLDKNFTTTLVAYDDGSYSILNWVGVEGYNIDFTVTDGKISVTNGRAGGDGYTYVHTGVPYNEADWECGIYDQGEYTSFEDGAENGSLYYYAYNGYDTFEWTTKTVVSGIDTIKADNDGDAIYYDLQGRRVAQPSGGVFVKIENGKAVKVIVR